MRTINNRQELNRYYNLVNSGLDRYFKDYKVLPSDLVVYVKNNLQEIKEELGVEDVNGIERVIMDVATHFYHSQMDNILTFEKFCLYEFNNHVRS